MGVEDAAPPYRLYPIHFASGQLRKVNNDIPGREITGNPFACCAYARFNRSSDDGYYLSSDGLRPGFPARLFFASVFLSGAIALSL